MGRVSIDTPLLKRLGRLSMELVGDSETACQPNLSDVGLTLEFGLAPGSSWCSPLNALKFASTGGDGTHFSLLIQNNSVTDESPVIVSVPANSGEPEGANAIVGDSLRSFLQFGLLRGYFAMEQLVYRRIDALEAYSNPDWEPTADWHFGSGLAADDPEQLAGILQILAETFDLTPVGYSMFEFEQLQKRFLPQAQFLDFYDPL